MKKTVSPFCLVAVTCLALALSHASSFAQTARKGEPLPNVDKRVVAGNPAPLSPAKADALAALHNRIPGVTADIDLLLKSPNHISSTKGFLTGVDEAASGVTNAAEAHRIVKAFLNENAQLFGHGAEALEGAKIKREFRSAHNGLTTTVWQQEVDGIPLFKTVLIGHVTKNGELVNLSTHFLPNATTAADAGMPNRAATQNAPSISAAQAIINAAQNIGSVVASDQIEATSAPVGAARQQHFNAAPVLSGETFAELVWLPMNASTARLAWQVLLTSRKLSEMFLIVVDAQTGEVIVRHGLTEYISDATYNVFTSDSPSPFSPGHPVPNSGQPPLVPRTLVTTSALSVNASPNGWINDGNQETLGNNVHAHLDRDDNNQPDLPRPNGGANRVFDFPLNLGLEPSTYGDAAVVNLFYWNNWFHDRLYDLGFTEAAGNFQTDNFGRGGIGGDPVLADAQDGLDLLDPFHDNNANMATPPDGFSPRMQMYKFSGPNPDRDGDFDAEIILHEHAHGLSNRRVGGGVGLFNLQSRGMGEGWSDFYGLALLSEPGDNINAAYAVGGYATLNFYGLTENYYYGIRRYPYSTDMTKNPLTFKDIDPAQASSHPGIPTSPVGGGPANAVHNQGEVWCVTLWDARAALINKHGFSIGNELILQLVTDGMNLTPANPTFLQARDGILLADHVLTGGANQTELWAAFAKRGMGALAGSPASTTTAGVIESFDIPGLAYSSTIISAGNGNGIIDFNECNSLQITLTNIGVIGASNVTVMLTTTTPEVIVAQAFSLYPNIPSGGTGNNFTPFRISTSPTFVCGTDIELALVIKSDVDTRTNFFRLPSGVLGSPVRFNNNTAVAIPDNNPVGASSPIVVSNFNGTLGKVTVGLHITHTFDFDLVLQLVAPDGTTVTLSQNNGGSGNNYGASCSPDNSRTQFDDNAFLAISAGTAPFVGVFQPDQPLSTFNLKSGTNVNGTWQLKVIDQFGIDTGAIQCWSLFLSPQTCTDGGGECPGSDLAATMVAAPNPAITSSNLTYTITVTNHGPSAAKSVVLSQTLPPGVIFVSTTNSQGSAQFSDGIVTCNFGQIAARRGATLSVVVIPTEVGTISSTATVGSSQTDPDPSNNSVTLITRVVPPSADLAVTILDSPDPVSIAGNLTYTIAVTNRGPTSASNVRLTNALPATAALISASSTQGTFVNAGGTIIYNLGDIANGAGAVATIVVRPTEVGAITATSQVSSDAADLLPDNNVASATTTVTPAADLALSIVDNPDPAITGSNITYTFTLTNRGPNSVSSVAINGILPSSGQFISSDSPSLIVSGNTFSLNIAGTFSSGSSLTFSILFEAPGVPAQLTLSATASASQADPNLANNSASVTTSVAFAAAVIAADGSTLITESISPANGSVDSGETVDVALRLRNVGNISTTNLVATLLTGNGVAAPSAPQSYGVLVSGSDSVSRTFRFTANGTNGQTITATLQLQDGSGPSTNVNFTFTLPTTHTFSNTNLITISNVGPANPYPSEINVSGVTGLVDRVIVTLNKINHTYPDDIDILLVDPTGRKVLLMSDAGGANQLNNVVLTLDSASATALADFDQLVSGNFRPADYSDLPTDFFTNAPAGPYGTSLDLFDGTAPNGIWSLYVVDDSTGDLGNIAAGWTLSVTTIKPVNKIAELSIAVSASTSAALINENISYTFVITNNGPDTASNVTLNNALPANATAISSTFTNLGDLPPGSNATVTVAFTATGAGLLTNTATVSASEIDLNLLNNSASAVTAIGSPAADLGITISASPGSIVGNNHNYTITVTNNGPHTAYGIVVTNRLPVAAAYVSASTPVTVAGGVVTCALGNLGAGNSVSFSITATMLATGNITNTANVVTTSIDGNGANNSASIVTLVANPAPNIIASGTHLEAENLIQNSSIDPGETVTISLALANIGSANTANLVATLLATGGVSPSSAQNYGVLVNNGPAVSRPFTFTASGVIGGAITATLQLQDGANNLGTVTFTFDLPHLRSFTNATAISIPSSGPATPYPSIITVTGANGVVSKVTVALKGLTHTFPDDLDILLVSPGGQKMLLMSDVGGSYGINGVNLSFDVSGPELPDATQIVSGIVRPTDFESGESLSPPAPAGPYASSFATFNGSIPNGDWSLYVNDDSGADFGNISGGWTLDLTTVNPINQEVINTDIVLAAAIVNGNYQLTVTGQSGLTYRIEASIDLVNWTAISTNIAVNGSFNIVDAPAPSPRFYRAVLVP